MWLAYRLNDRLFGPASRSLHILGPEVCSGLHPYRQRLYLSVSNNAEEGRTQFPPVGSIC